MCLSPWLRRQSWGVCFQLPDRLVFCTFLILISYNESILVRPTTWLPGFYQTDSTERKISCAIYRAEMRQDAGYGGAWIRSAITHVPKLHLGDSNCQLTLPVLGCLYWKLLNFHITVQILREEVKWDNSLLCLSLDSVQWLINYTCGLCSGSIFPSFCMLLWKSLNTFAI